MNTENPQCQRLMSRKDRRKLDKGLPFEPIPYYVGAGKTISITYFHTKTGINKRVTFHKAPQRYMVPA